MYRPIHYNSQYVTIVKQKGKNIVKGGEKKKRKQRELRQLGHEDLHPQGKKPITATSLLYSYCITMYPMQGLYGNLELGLHKSTWAYTSFERDGPPLTPLKLELIYHIRPA